MEKLLTLGTITLLSFAGFSVLLQEFGKDNEREVLELRLEVQQLQTEANACQTNAKRLENDFRIYRDAIKDSR